jgi:homocysteine S-methyltransferase
MRILDGGLATELEARGFDLDDPLWSARVLIEHPDAIRDVHRAYVEAGADCVITATYQASLEAPEVTPGLLRRAVQLARESGARMVAASVGPYGAALANGAEYTGDYPGMDVAALAGWHEERFGILAASGADVLACETIPSADEAAALALLARQHPEIPAWFSFSCGDGAHLRDGSPIQKVAAECARVPNVIAIGVNCTAPRFVNPLLDALRAASAVPAIVYPNSGEDYDARAGTWRGESDVASFARRAVEWRDRGAQFIGGCCRVGPAHICGIRAALQMP